MREHLVRSVRGVAAGMALLGMMSVQVGCYNTYVIDREELRKLESSVEQREVVEVYGDCPTGSTATSRYRVLDGSYVAQAEGDAPSAPEVPAQDSGVASDAAGDAPAGRAGCVTVPVSTANALRVVTIDNQTHRVTPFNFIMSDSQLVSPEYDLLLSLDQVTGAKVKRFSTGKTVATIVGVTLLTVGTFAAIAVLAPDDPGFQ